MARSDAGKTKPFRRCGLCSALFEEGTLLAHRDSEVHQKALRKMLDSPLTNPDPGREKPAKYGDRKDDEEKL